MKDALFLAAVRQMFNGAWDVDKGGVPGAIRSTNYNVAEPPTRYSSWVDAATLTLRAFRCVIAGVDGREAGVCVHVCMYGWVWFVGLLPELLTHW